MGTFSIWHWLVVLFVPFGIYWFSAASFAYGTENVGKAMASLAYKPPPDCAREIALQKISRRVEARQWRPSR